MTGHEICVVGASNVDLISYIPRLPSEGETLHGTEFRMGFGGKGANQAVMAARLGASVAMITKLGDDIFGNQTLENFQKNGIDTANIHFTDQAFSGVAPIAVDPEGRNSIIIVTGANDLLTREEIDSARNTIISSKVLICQMEIPIQISLEAMKIAKSAGLLTIFNPAPAQVDIPYEVYDFVDIILPNKTEIEIMTGIKIKTNRDVKTAGRMLIERGIPTVIITLGSQGSMLITEKESKIFGVDNISVVDSTGAGDAFIGSLAVYLARGKSISDAVSAANKIAGISVQSKGTQTSFPLLEDLSEELTIGLSGGD